MKSLLLSFFFLTGIALGGACGGNAEGGTEFGNPTRSLIGELDPSDGGLSSCPADRVIATDTAGETTQTDVRSGCSFELPLTPDRSYVISYTLEDQFVATLIFQSSVSSLTSSVLFVSSGSTGIDLGKITFDNGKASPEKNPVAQNDRDGDGDDDLDDEDDDNDSTPDEEEEDCDLDGYLDDDDESECEEEEDEEEGDNGGDDEEDEGEGEAEQPRVLEVTPRNGETHVDLDDEIRLRFGCAIDESTLTAGTFTVTAQNDTVTCEFDLDDSGDRVDCEHEEDPFLENRTYTATVAGMKCEDGQTIAATSWSWTTEED